MDNVPRISVVIPTYHDWKRLELCIAALSRQDLADELYEVIIVNNDPADPSPHDISLPNNCYLIYEEKVGSYAARNAALRIARGSIIAFTDSDCIPQFDWLSQASGYINEGADRVGGTVELFYKGASLTWAEIYEKAFAFRQRKNVAHGLSVTANFITTRAVLDEVGDFDDSLLSGGDIEWNRRASAMGKNIIYGELCVVQHPARAEMGQLLGKRKRVIGGKEGSAIGVGIKVLKMCKQLLPPVLVLPALIQNKSLTFREKLIAFGVCYYLKISSFLVLVRLFIGLERPGNT